MNKRNIIKISLIFLGSLILIIFILGGYFIIDYEYNSYLYRKTLPNYWGDMKLKDHSFYFNNFLFVRMFSLLGDGFNFSKDIVKVYDVHNLPNPMNNDIIINIYYKHVRTLKHPTFSNNNNSKLIVEFHTFEGNTLFEQTIYLKDFITHIYKNESMLGSSNPVFYHNHKMTESDVENIRKIKITYIADKSTYNSNINYSIRLGFGSFLEHY